MRSHDVGVAADAVGVSDGELCAALRTALPVMRELERASKGWKFWLRWGMAALIAAFEGYVARSCGGEQ